MYAALSTKKKDRMSAGFSLENCTAGDVFFSGSKTLKVRINIGIHANYTTYNLEFHYIINRNARNRHETMNLFGKSKS